MLNNSDFSPNPLLKNPHIQTLWPRIVNGKPKYSFYTERLELEDGDFVDLSWTEKELKQEHKAIVAVFHGLEGCIESPYAKGIMHAIKENSWLGVLMHFRSCSGEINRLERSYHSGETGDIAHLLKILEQRFPRLPLCAVGYSLGGNALLKYLGENKQHCPLTSATAVSVPFCLDLGAKRLEHGFSRLYQWYLLNSLQKKMRKKFANRTAPFELDKVHEQSTFWLFDHNITAPIHGFSSAEEYYRLCSSRQFLIEIETPTLIIHAEDDPFVPKEAIPNEHELSGQVQLELSLRGGHVGFISGRNPFQPEFWLEKRIPKFIHDQLT